MSQTNSAPISSNQKGKQQPEPPDAWIYTLSVLQWIFEPALGNQLPISYQIFRLYAYWYFRLTGETYLKRGRELFQFLVNYLERNAGDRPLKFKLPNCEIFVDRFDARFFQVINELTNPQSDLQILTHFLSAGDTFIDIGANHGSFAIAASKLVGKGGRIIAVEAQPHLAKILEMSLAINVIGDFEIYAVAVGNTEGEVEFLIPSGTSGSAGIFAEHSATNQFKAIAVPIRRFDDLVIGQDFTGTTLIKLDIEGSETAFLLGAAKIISQLKPTLIIEIHPGTLKAAQTSGESLKLLLQNLGYLEYAELEHWQDKFPLANLNTDTQRNIVIYHQSKLVNKG